jgi:hypothetical protein
MKKNRPFFGQSEAFSDFRDRPKDSATDSRVCQRKYSGHVDCLLEVSTLEEDANLPAARRKIEEIAPSWPAHISGYSCGRCHVSIVGMADPMLAPHRHGLARFGAAFPPREYEGGRDAGAS